MTQPRTFALAPATRARMMGVTLVGLALLLGLVTALTLALHLNPTGLTIIILLTLVAVFTLGFLLVRRWYVVRVDDDGYQVRFVRGVGAAAAQWGDVEDVATASVAGARCVVLRLRDGRTTTVPVDVLEGDPQEFTRELGRRLEEHQRSRRVG